MTDPSTAVGVVGLIQMISGGFMLSLGADDTQLAGTGIFVAGLVTTLVGVVWGAIP